MKIMGCIAEFNPFHNGHKYFIEASKKETGATHTVAVMSEYFTQRGEPALLTPSARAEAAIRCGVDLVLSLPVSFALSSAEKFAFGGVYILNSLGIVNNLVYGSECGVNNDIISVSKTVMSDAFTAEMSSISDKTLTFAAMTEIAGKKSVTDMTSEKISKILSNPNDILAVEYNKALMKLHSNIESAAIKRINVEHDSDSTVDNFASASLIRDKIKNKQKYERFLPKETVAIIEREIKLGRVVCDSYGDRVLSVLRRLDRRDFTAFDGVTEGIENRIISQIRSSNSLFKLYDNVKSKRYAHSRIRRIIMSSFIGFVPQLTPSAVKVLAFNDKGAEILRLAKKTCEIPIITKPSDYPSNNADIAQMMCNESKAANMFGVLCKDIIEMGDEYKKIPVKFIKNH